MYQREKENSLITGWDKISISIDFDNIEQYCSMLNRTLEKEQIIFNENVQKAVGNMDENEKASFYEYRSDDHWRLHDVFPSFHWNSTFVTAYSLFEYHLNDICECLQDKSESKIKVKIIKGKGIERSKIYLSAIWNLHDCFNGENWSSIKDYALIRNRLVHNSGELNLDKNGPKDHKRIGELLEKKFDAIEINKDGEFGIGRIKSKSSLVIESIRIYKSFLFTLCDMEKPS